MITSLKNKKIVLGVCGSIAAYKSVVLCRELIKGGADVRVVMTESAKTFVTPLTFSTISKNPVFHGLIDADQWNNHVELGLWADLIVIAPATASTMSKMATGNADNLLLAVYLSAKCPVCIAPAMDLDMWKHPATKQNIRTLTDFGHHLIPVGTGELASGLNGEGRMAEPEQIVAFITEIWEQSAPLKGKKVLITAGPTYENIDPVRFIGNASSGKMGIALADVCSNAGAEVILVLGPSTLLPANPNVETVQVVSAEQMYDACKKFHENSDIVIFAAAVADYKPRQQSTVKIKKQSEELYFDLVKTVDIAASLGKHKKNKQIHVGFALETHNEEENARYKMHEKNFDLVVLNSLQDEGAGFSKDTNKITIMDKAGNEIAYPVKSKQDVAKDILQFILDKMGNQ